MPNEVRNFIVTTQNTSQHKGKKIARFEDLYGNELEDLYMCEEVVIVLEDGEKIILSQDWRGSECYISQRS
jgi:predicted DNA-binding protein